jgi:uncharacterized UBP type Zn finger protein
MGTNSQGIQEDFAARLKEVTDMGFDEKKARDALSKCNNDVGNAINFLLSAPMDIDPELERVSNP